MFLWTLRISFSHDPLLNWRGKTKLLSPTRPCSFLTRSKLLHGLFDQEHGAAALCQICQLNGDVFRFRKPCTFSRAVRTKTVPRVFFEKRLKLFSELQSLLNLSTAKLLHVGCLFTLTILYFLRQCYRVERLEMKRVVNCRYVLTRLIHIMINCICRSFFSPLFIIVSKTLALKSPTM